MFKQIPGNSVYSINLDGIVLAADKTQLVVVANMVTIDLFGITRTVHIDWLKYVAHFEIYFSSAADYKLLSFVDIKIVKRAGIPILPILDRPIYYLHKYRVIPNFSRYAISVDGVVIRMCDNKIIPPEKHRLGGYPVVDLYNPEIGENTHLVLHRLIALVWVKNDDIFNKCNVNHKDGDRENFAVNNLEWVTPAQNCLHAIETGRRVDTAPIDVLNVETGEIYQFPSLRQACQYMGVKSSDLSSLPKYKLINDIYKYRLKDSEEWLPKTLVRPPSTNQEISALNVTTGEIIHTESIREMSRVTGIGFSIIHASLFNDPVGSYYGISNWAFARGHLNEWPCTPTKLKTSRHSLKAISVECEDNVIEFESLRSAATFFKVDRSTIQQRLKSGNALSKYKLISTAHFFK